MSIERLKDGAPFLGALRQHINYKPAVANCGDCKRCYIPADGTHWCNIIPTRPFATAPNACCDCFTT